MARYKSRNQSWKQSPVNLPPKNLCKALMVSDGTIIREKIRKDYEKASAQVVRVKRLIQRFSELDIPAFESWKVRMFGSYLTEIREFERKIWHNEETISRVDYASRVLGIPCFAAYEKYVADPDALLREVEAEQAKLDAEFKEMQRKCGEEQAKRGGAKNKAPVDEEAQAEADLESMFNSFFDQIFGGGGDEDDENPFSGDFRGFGPSTQTPPPRESPRLKELYRILVRKLHPDINTNPTSEEREAWHQVQDAYEAGDEHRMEGILTMLEIKATGIQNVSSMSNLSQLTIQVLATLREFNRELRKLKRNVAWNFASKKDYGRIQARLEAEFRLQLGDASFKMRQSEDIINKWKKSIARELAKKSKATPTPPPPSSESAPEKPRPKRSKKRNHDDPFNHPFFDGF